METPAQNLHSVRRLLARIHEQRVIKELVAIDGRLFASDFDAESLLGRVGSFLGQVKLLVPESILVRVVERTLEREVFDVSTFSALLEDPEAWKDLREIYNVDATVEAYVVSQGKGEKTAARLGRLGREIWQKVPAEKKARARSAPTGPRILVPTESASYAPTAIKRRRSKNRTVAELLAEAGGSSPLPSTSAAAGASSSGPSYSGEWLNKLASDLEGLGFVRFTDEHRAMIANMAAETGVPFGDASSGDQQ